MNAFLRTLRQPSLLLLSLAMTACVTSKPTEFTLTYNFNASAHGWEAGFADYPVGEESFYQLSSGWKQLPSPLSQLQGIHLIGNNHSDDLLMFIKKKVNGLKANTSYSLYFELEIATNAPFGCVGIGGAPGESVAVKAGASFYQPLLLREAIGTTDYYRLNIDHGNQMASGANAIVIGDMAGSSSNCSNITYEVKTLNNAGTPFTASSANDGSLWLILASDSGFEGVTSFYFTKAVITAREVQ